MKNDSSDKIVLALAKVDHCPDIKTLLGNVYKLQARAKLMAKEIRREARIYWLPSVQRLCVCGHKFDIHNPANCDHEVGGVCVQHRCASYCGSRHCACKTFRDRPGNRLKP